MIDDDTWRALQLAQTTSITGVGGPASQTARCEECGADLGSFPGVVIAIRCGMCGAEQHRRRPLSRDPETVPGLPTIEAPTFPSPRPPDRQGPTRLTSELDAGLNDQIPVRCARGDCKKLLDTIVKPRRANLGDPPFAGLLVVDSEYKVLWQARLKEVSDGLHSERVAGVVYRCRRCKHTTLAVLSGKSVVKRYPFDI
jgi:hypothetical protein